MRFGPISPRFRVYHTFSRDIIRSNWAKINESPLKKTGLLLRKIERQSIRVDRTKKQTPSRPGRPPKSRFPGHPFRLIYSVPNRMATNVIVGHVGFRSGQTPMEMHEFGQRVRIKRLVPSKTRRRILNKHQRALVRQLFLSGRIQQQKRKERIVTETITMPERPFARPALEKGMKRIPRLWENSFNRGTVKN